MLPTSYEDFSLHQRALEALRQRQMQVQAQAVEQGDVITAGAVERPDPNLGMYNDIVQGLEETAGGGRMRTKLGAPMQGLMGYRF